MPKTSHIETENVAQNQNQGANISTLQTSPNGPKTQILHVCPEQLKNADWNYKQLGTLERREKLRASIQHDGSVGVLAVREIPPQEGGPLALPDGRPIYETCDGNHRLEQVLALGWQQIPVENFGPISKGEAVLLARRRNQNWFDDDLVELGELIRDEVLPGGDYTVQELAQILPDSEAEITAILDLVQAHEWKDEAGQVETKTPSEAVLKITLHAKPEFENIWAQTQAKMRLTHSEPLDSKREIAAAQTVERLCKAFLAGEIKIVSDAALEKELVEYQS